MRWYEHPEFQYVPPGISHLSHTDNNSEISFFDPWEDYYEKLQHNSTNDTQFVDETSSHFSETFHLNVTDSNGVSVDQSHIQNWVQQQSCINNHHNAHNAQETQHFDEQSEHNLHIEDHSNEDHSNYSHPKRSSSVHSISHNSNRTPSPVPSSSATSECSSHKHTRRQSSVSNFENAPPMHFTSDAQDDTASVCENSVAHLNSANSIHTDETTIETCTSTITINTVHDTNASTDCYSEEVRSPTIWFILSLSMSSRTGCIVWGPIMQTHQYIYTIRQKFNIIRCLLCEVTV